MERRAIQVRGIVQGVGFRPYVFGLASQLSLRGFVRNQAGSVCIEVEGGRDSLDSFLDELVRRPPPLARIQAISWQPVEYLGQADFRIETSRSGGASQSLRHELRPLINEAVFVSPDVGTCDACLAELFDPGDRRFRYPFINCTHCGPRLTIVTGAPYDRPQTTMSQFAMCAACRAEYEDPADRRFHAQPIACPDCGPSLQLLDAAGQQVDCPNPLAEFARAVASGRIGALKGLGGFHLVCDASSEAAVGRLRQRKDREEKPLAIMLPDAVSAEAWCQISPEERALLQSPRKPIVLLRKRTVGPGQPSGLAAAIAPGNPWLGVMLPYTPLHHLLVDVLDGCPLVMTSGNRSDEPIAYRDETVAGQLDGIADLFLTHNRPIHVRADDSVTRVLGGQEMPIRRSRGYAPEPIRLPIECSRPTLALGGQLKGTFALADGNQAIISHHLGDLDHYQAVRALATDIELYQQLFGIRLEVLVHDLHPDYASTRHARERAAAESLELIAVQHHHAHLASCLADNGLCEPAIGVTLDGTGYGLDGAVWGGEFLVGDFASFRRAAHFRYVGMPGGDQAIRQPWRMAVAHLLDAGCDPGLVQLAVPATRVRTIEQMLARGLNCPPTSSVGRLFDAAAALAGVRTQVTYEGQAAVEMEWLAAEAPERELYPYAVGSGGSASGGSASGGSASGGSGNGDEPLVVDTRPIVRAMAADRQLGLTPSAISRALHQTLVAIICDVCNRLRVATGLNLVALSGGVFQNALLGAQVRQQLESRQFRVCAHRQVPAGDGGLSLGQLAIAAARLDRRAQAESNLGEMGIGEADVVEGAA